MAKYIRTLRVFAPVRKPSRSLHTVAWSAERAAIFLICGHASNRKVFFGASIRKVFFCVKRKHKHNE